MSKKMKKPVYEVNPHTMIILPLKTKSGVQSEVFELNDHRISSFTPLFLIKTSCQYFGSSYEGTKINESLILKCPYSALVRAFYI